MYVCAYLMAAVLQKSIFNLFHVIYIFFPFSISSNTFPFLFSYVLLTDSQKSDIYRLTSPLHNMIINLHLITLHLITTTTTTTVTTTTVTTTTPALPGACGGWWEGNNSRPEPRRHKAPHPRSEASTFDGV